MPMETFPKYTKYSYLIMEVHHIVDCDWKDVHSEVTGWQTYWAPVQKMHMHCLWKILVSYLFCFLSLVSTWDDLEFNLGQLFLLFFYTNTKSELNHFQFISGVLMSDSSVC